MKYVVSFIVGLTVGVAAFALLMYYNPFSAPQTISPLAVSENPMLNLQYSVVPDDSIFYTNDGESSTAPFPAGADELWEPTVNATRVLVTELSDARGSSLGIGIKFSTDSEATRLLNSEALVDSVWHIHLPQSGTFFVEQTENYWAYLRDIVIRARLNSTDSWRGAWSRVVTTGPNALGTGRALGGSGRYAGIEGEAVEILNATAYSSASGPVAMNGMLTIALPESSSP
ncbi:MAG: hypothetical protein R3315_06695 [Woeseiaceae bacterium]|nr:hypothetical protein [Woeseiaceae bacterium]